MHFRRISFGNNVISPLLCIEEIYRFYYNYMSQKYVTTVIRFYFILYGFRISSYLSLSFRLL